MIVVNELSCRNAKITDFSNTELEKLVSSLDNLNIPIHNWYNFKEGYSHHFPLWLLDYLHENYGFIPSQALDPFMGSGTSLLSLAERDISCDGVEYNPFIFWMAKVKLTAHLIPKLELLNAFKSIDLCGSRNSKLNIPNLSTFRNNKYFKESYLNKILDIRDQIRKSEYSTRIKDLLLLALIDALNEATSLKKDGRALRYLNDKITVDPKLGFTDWFYRMYDDLDVCKTHRASRFKHVLVNDSALSSTNKIYATTNKYDLVLFSPPYLNGFDYSEIYKLELWLLEFVKHNEEWLNLRRNSVQSHWSVKFEEKNVYKKLHPDATIFNNILSDICDGTLNGSTKRVKLMIDGFVEDMHKLFSNLNRVVKPGGYTAYMVSTSMYGNHHVETDLLMAEIAENNGFELQEIIILKKRRSRVNGSFIIRDSVIILKK